VSGTRGPLLECQRAEDSLATLTTRIRGLTRRIRDLEDELDEERRWNVRGRENEDIQELRDRPTRADTIREVLALLHPVLDACRDWSLVEYHLRRLATDKASSEEVDFALFELRRWRAA
jgi:hypothetical protein